MLVYNIALRIHNLFDHIGVIKHTAIWNGSICIRKLLDGHPMGQAAKYTRLGVVITGFQGGDAQLLGKSPGFADPYFFVKQLECYRIERLIQCITRRDQSLIAVVRIFRNVIPITAIFQNNRGIIHDTTRLHKTAVQCREIGSNRFHCRTRLTNHLGGIIHLLLLEVPTFHHSKNGACFMLNQNSRCLFVTLGFTSGREVILIFCNLTHRFVYALINGGVHHITACAKLLFSFFEQIIIVLGFGICTGISCLTRIGDRHECLRSLSFCFYHKIWIGVISLNSTWCERFFDIKSHRFIILCFIDFVLLQHSTEHQVLAVDGSFKASFIKLTLTVVSRIGRRKLWQTCQIGSLGYIKLVQIILIKDTFGRCFNAKDVVTA
ncbi:hypothetical protein D1872_172230 [compost metagenome]